jgi:hypothetical protein
MTALARSDASDFFVKQHDGERVRDLIHAPCVNA